MRGGIGDGVGGFRPQVAGLLSFSGRPLSLLVKKTLFYPEEHSPGFFFLPRGRAPERWSPLREFLFLNFPPLSFFFDVH